MLPATHNPFREPRHRKSIGTCTHLLAQWKPNQGRIFYLRIARSLSQRSGPSQTLNKTSRDKKSRTPSPDRPGINPNTDDKLGYAPFAKNLATSIATIPPTDGLVVGLYGAWGLGKSTVLNFVEFEIQAAARFWTPLSIVEGVEAAIKKGSLSELEMTVANEFLRGLIETKRKSEDGPASQN